MTPRMRKQGTSGQALVIASLIISVLLLSTTYCVFETKRAMIKDATATNSSLDSIRLSTANTMISALANFTNGGEREVLIADLSRLSSSIRNHFYEDRCLIQFTPLNSSPYENGLYIMWGQDGIGISGSYVRFVVNSSGPTETYYSEYSINITTTLSLKSTYASVDAQRNVNVTCGMSNENEVALMNDIQLFYRDEPDGPWTIVDSYNSFDDFGNGTYLFSFNVPGQGFLQISASAHDLRDVMVATNVTSTQV